MVSEWYKKSHHKYILSTTPCLLRPRSRSLSSLRCGQVQSASIMASHKTWTTSSLLFQTRFTQFRGDMLALRNLLKYFPRRLTRVLPSLSTPSVSLLFVSILELWAYYVKCNMNYLLSDAKSQSWLSHRDTLWPRMETSICQGASSAYPTWMNSCAWLILLLIHRTKLMASEKPNVQDSLNIWYPPHIRRKIDYVLTNYPGGFVDMSGGMSSPDLSAGVQADLAQHELRRYSVRFVVNIWGWSVFALDCTCLT